MQEWRGDFDFSHESRVTILYNYTNQESLVCQLQAGRRPSQTLGVFSEDSQATKLRSWSC